MSDRFASQIEIGGKVSRLQRSVVDPDETILHALMAMITQEGVSHEYGATVVHIVTEAELLEHLDSNGHLLFRDDQAVNGAMTDLEEFCQDEGLSYRRVSGMYPPYLGEVVYFHPGHEIVTFSCDDDGNELVPAKVVCEALRYFEEGDNAMALSILHSRCSPEPKDMPKFEIVD